MKNLFVPYELSLQAKNNGFNEHTLTYYMDFGTKDKPDIRLSAIIMSFKEDDNVIFDNTTFGEYSCSAPLYQQLLDWFLDKYDIFIHIVRVKDKYFGVIDQNGVSNMYFEKKGSNIPLKSTIKAIEEAFKLISDEA
jgi:hypothetical protein